MLISKSCDLMSTLWNPELRARRERWISEITRVLIACNKDKEEE